jgi:hypothetical protein
MNNKAINIQLLIDYITSKDWSVQFMFDECEAEAILYHRSYEKSNFIPLPHFSGKNIDELIEKLMTFFNIIFYKDNFIKTI